MEKEKEIASKARRKIIFELPQDEGGYPPFTTEGAWANPLPNGGWVLDNIPFYIYDVSNHDEVAVKVVDGEIFFDHVVRRGGHSTLRVHFDDSSIISEVRKALKALGCSSEGALTKTLVAVDVPPTANLQAVEDCLKPFVENEAFEYEHGCVQHVAAQ
jgi:Domain of unknown function (DUF4265)